MKEYPFQGNIVTTGLTADQLFEMMLIAARRVRDEKPETPSPDDDLPEMIPAALAADVLKYKSAVSLRQYHTKLNGLKPVRRKRRTFYHKSDVLKLRKILFGQ